MTAGATMAQNRDTDGQGHDRKDTGTVSVVAGVVVVAVAAGGGDDDVDMNSEYHRVMDWVVLTIWGDPVDIGW